MYGEVVFLRVLIPATMNGSNAILVIFNDLWRISFLYWVHVLSVIRYRADLNHWSQRLNGDHEQLKAAREVFGFTHVTYQTSDHPWISFLLSYFIGALSLAVKGHLLKCGVCGDFSGLITCWSRSTYWKIFVCRADSQILFSSAPLPFHLIHIGLQVIRIFKAFSFVLLRTVYAMFKKTNTQSPFSVFFPLPNYVVKAQDRALSR